MKKGLLVRVVFNNERWSGRCRHPVSDPRCFKCVGGNFQINDGEPITEDEYGICKGKDELGDYPPSNHPLETLEPHWCWEQLLCKDLFWASVRGKWRSVFPGMPVYFVYPEPDGTLTLWGHTTVDRVENDHDEYPLIYFKEFEPLPDKKWASDLSGEKITGSRWGQGQYRYLDEKHESYLASLIKGNARRHVPSKESEGGDIEDLSRDLVPLLRELNKKLSLLTEVLKENEYKMSRRFKKRKEVKKKLRDKTTKRR